MVSIFADMNTEMDPFRIFSRWYAEAQKTGMKEPGIMALATVGPGGRPSARIVLLKDFDDRGFIFFTNYQSRKATGMDQNPWVSAVLHWEDPGYQVRMEGRAEKIEGRESDRYFSSRPRGSQLSAWASAQSSEIPSRQWLVKEMKRYEKQYQGKPVPRPAYWGGYRLIPDRFEFWKDSKDRLHERVEFIWVDKNWVRRILAP